MLPGRIHTRSSYRLGDSHDNGVEVIGVTAREHRASMKKEEKESRDGMGMGEGWCIVAADFLPH